MLASTCRPGHGWMNTGAFAFSPPPSFNAKDDPLRSTPSTCSSLLHSSTSSANQNVRNFLMRPPCNGLRKRPYDLATADRGGTSSTYRPGGLSCLRGGSSAEGGPHPASKSDEDGGVNGGGSGIIPSPTATGSEGESGEAAAAAGTAAEFGVALVTERSTATGGSKSRVSYSVLADGTLQVGSPRRRQPTADLVRALSPPILLSPAAPTPTPSQSLLGNADSAALTPAAEGLPAVGPRKAMQGLRKRTRDFKTGASKAMKGVASEARAVAVGAGEHAGRVGVAARGGLMNTFLPAGYPASVRPEYARYRCWDIVQDLSSHLRGVLATQAVLEGMGVGRAGSTPLAATLQWMARDGASMIGGLLFTSIASANFGVNIKTWRLFADASNDVGLALEMLAPLPAFREGGRFLRLICLASVFKAACGVAGGATAAAITEHWAVDNNIADIGAKNGAQHTLASLLGLGLSVWFARAVSDAGSASGTRVWGWYVVLTAVHLLANYLAMRTLALRSLNPSRASLLVTEYLGQALASPERRQGAGQGGEEEGGGGGREGGQGDEEKEGPDWMGRTVPGFLAEVLSPSKAAKREKIIMLPGWMRALKPWGDVLQINVGVPVRALVTEADDLLWLASLYHDEKAMVGVRVSYKPLGPRMGTKINLALREDASAEDRLQAMFQANVIHRALAGDPDGIPQGGDGVERTLFLRRVTEEALRVTRRDFPSFKKALVREGWDLSRVTLGAGPWVGRWGSLAKED
ncbi:unnamed protein product [Laminaria digitata]